jgi:ribonuclease HII
MIDEINILQASLKAMELALVESAPVHLPGVVLIDGNKKLKHENPLHEQHAVIGGDAQSLLIGLASIAAKEYRDQLMKKLSADYCFVSIFQKPRFSFCFVVILALMLLLLPW